MADIMLKTAIFTSSAAPYKTEFQYPEFGEAKAHTICSVALLQDTWCKKQA